MIFLPFFLGVAWGFVALLIPSAGLRMLGGLTVGVGILGLFIAGVSDVPLLTWLVVLVEAWVPYLLLWGIGYLIYRRRTREPI